ncbi:MAG: hypothetical protein R6U26_03825 [Candidatus Undinarchaeales archaeon]
MTTKSKHTTVSIPKQLAKNIKAQIKGTGFTSISDYVTYVMREVVSGKGAKEEAFSEEDEKKVKERLKDLGYI